MKFDHLTYSETDSQWLHFWKTGLTLFFTVVKDIDAGIVVRGPRLLATLGPLPDELDVYPARSHRLAADTPEQDSFAFAIPFCL